jgi:uncharacterized phage protein gp47/JayE
VTTPAPQPAVDFASRDYVSYRASLLDRARAIVPEWRPGDENDFAMVMVELIAYLGDNLSYFLDRSASETFLPTAQLRANVIRQAQLLGYRPAQQVASHVVLTVSVFDASTATIPAGTQFTTAPELDTVPLVFETDADLTFPGGSPGVEQVAQVPATQGVSVLGEEVAASTGTPGQFYGLFRQPVLDSSVQLYVQDDPNSAPRRWTYVDHLIEAGPNDEVFSTDVDRSGVTLILFGNNVTGKVPARGATIAVNYRIGGGAATNVAAGTITQMVDPISDVVAVTNQEPATGGQDAEGIESIRANAPFAYAAQNRAFNEADFRGLALRIPGVGKAKAASVVWQNWIVYVAPSNGDLPSDALLSQVQDFIMDGRALQGMNVRAASVVYVPVDLAVLVTVYDEYDRESVRTAVSNALDVLFDFQNPYGVADFGIDVQQGVVYTLVMAVEGVQACILQTLAPAGGTGAADIAIDDWQIAQLHTATVSATGGITTQIPMVDVAGGNPVMPGIAGAPLVGLSRCDAATTHLEMSWAVAPNATQYFVHVQYRDGTAAVLQESTFGGFATASAVLDIPSVPAAVSLSLQIRSYNGTTGPTTSATTSVANPCHT